MRAESGRAIGGLEGRITTLQQQLVAARAAAHVAEEKLGVVEREAAVADDKADLVPHDFGRARASLEATGAAPALGG